MENDKSQITENEVLEFLKHYENALATQSFENVSEQIHPSAIFRFSDGDFHGHEAIRQAFEKTWAYEVEDERYYLSEIEVRTLDVDSASLTFQFHWEGIGENGSFEIVGRGTMVLTRLEGKLKILVEHLSR